MAGRHESATLCAILRRSKRAGTSRRATNPSTGGRPSRLSVGTCPRTGQVLRYFLTLTGPSRSSVSGPTWCWRSLVAHAVLHGTSSSTSTCRVLVPGLGIGVCCFGWSSPLVSFLSATSMFQPTVPSDQPQHWTARRCFLTATSTVMSTRSFQVALRPGRDQFGFHALFHTTVCGHRRHSCPQTRRRQCGNSGVKMNSGVTFTHQRERE